MSKDWEGAESGRNGDGLARVIASMTPYITSRVAALSVPGCDADDLRQEAYIALFTAIDSFDPERGVLFSTYAAACIDNRLRDALRRASAAKNAPLNRSETLDDGNAGGLPSAGPTPEEIVESREELAEVLGRMDRELSAYEKRVLLLALDGCEVREIAQLLGTAPRSVTNALSRARAKLKQ